MSEMVVASPPRKNPLKFSTCMLRKKKLCQTNKVFMKLILCRDAYRWSIVDFWVLNCYMVVLKSFHIIFHNYTDKVFCNRIGETFRISNLILALTIQKYFTYLCFLWRHRWSILDIKIFVVFISISIVSVSDWNSNIVFVTWILKERKHVTEMKIWKNPTHWNPNATKAIN